MAFLDFLASIRNPVLDVIMQGITFLGEETVFMVIALTLFWCVSKKHGYYILITGFFGTIISQFLKLVFRIPRPWVTDPNFKPVPSAVKGASGYAFPSGHSSNAVSTYGGIARFTEIGWLRWASIALTILICFSRMYLGVHTPLDVGAAFAISLVLLLVLFPILDKSDENPKIMYILSAVMIAVAVAYLYYVNFYLSPSEFDAESIANYTEGIANGWKLFGALLAMPIIYTLDLKKLHFEVKAPLPGQILKVALGLVCLLTLKEGMKYGLRAVFGEDAYFVHAVRYFAIVMFAGAVWPLTFPWFQRIGKKREEQ